MGAIFNAAPPMPMVAMVAFDLLDMRLIAVRRRQDTGPANFRCVKQDDRRARPYSSAVS